MSNKDKNDDWVTLGFLAGAVSFVAFTVSEQVGGLSFVALLAYIIWATDEGTKTKTAIFFGYLMGVGIAGFTSGI